jgi:tight adherence protein B
VLTLVLAVVGPIACAGLVAAGRRAAVADRVRRLGPRSRRRLPEPARGRLAAALRAADVALAPEEAAAWWGIGVLSAAMLAAALSPTLALPAALTALAAGPAGLVLARSRHERAFVASLPGVLDQVAAELRGGGTVAGAIDRLAGAPGPVAGDLRRIERRTRLGLPLAEALSAWPSEHDRPGVRAVAGAFSVAATEGGRAADAIDGLAASLRHRLDAVAEARSLSAQARLSAVVVGVAPLGYLAFSALVDPTAVTALVATGVGRVCLVTGLGLEALAGLWIRRIVRSAG